MPPFETLMIFTTAAIAITLVPGPSMLYVASRSVVHGRTAGICSALGLATGLLIHTAAASFGLSTIFVYFPPLFYVIKYFGAAYLVYLGIQMIRTNKLSPESGGMLPRLSYLRVYGQGVMTEILNPKTALFFLSFLPQFIDPLQGTPAMQMLILGSILVFTAFVADLFIAVSGGVLSRTVRAHPLMQKIQNWLAGTILIALGLRLATGEQQ